MRVLGEVNHEKYKITILEMSAKISIQIEDGMIVQTYRFRDGSMVSSLAQAKSFCTPQFLNQVSLNFDAMNAAQTKGINALLEDQEDKFPKII